MKGGKFMDSTSMTPADFSAMLGRLNDFGANGAWWLIILFLFMMGNGGWNRNDYGHYATAASQQEILFGQQFQNLDNKMDRIGNGIADATFALTNNLHTVQDNLGAAIGTEGRSLQAQISQIGCDLKTAIHAEGEATRGLIQANEIQTLRDKVSALEADNRMCGVVRYPMTYAYSAGQSPFCNCNCNNGNI